MIILCSVYDPASYRGRVYGTAVKKMVGKPGCQSVCKDLDFLAPTEEIVFGHKHNCGDTRWKSYPKVTTEQYTNVYRRLLAKRWAEVKAWLDELDIETDITLCCYCPGGKFCHRQLIAKMLAKHRPDIKVILR